MATLFYRSPKVRVLTRLPHVRSRLETQVTEENIREHQHRLLQGGTLVEAETLRKGVADEIEIILSDPAQLRFNDFFARSWKLANILSQKGFHIVRAHSNAFITSDSPVFSMTIPTNAPAYTGGGLAAERVAVFLALSPRTLLVVGPAGTAWDEYATAEFVSDLQQATVEAADRVVFALENIPTLQSHVDESLGRLIYVAEHGASK